MNRRTDHNMPLTSQQQARSVAEEELELELSILSAAAAKLS